MQHTNGRNCVNTYIQKGLAHIGIGEDEIPCIEYQGGVFCCEQGCICASGLCIGTNVYRQCSGRACTVSVGDGIGYRCWTSKIQRRRETERSVAVDCHDALRWVDSGGQDPEYVAVNIRIVAQNIDIAQCFTKSGTADIGIGYGCIVYWFYIKHNSSCRCTAIAVGHGVRKACRAIIVSIGCKHHVAANNRHTTVRSSLH